MRQTIRSLADENQFYALPSGGIEFAQFLYDPDADAQLGVAADLSTFPSFATS